MSAARPRFLTLGELAGAGELGVSGWLTVAQDRIDCFADCTGDRQWIHVDVERARRESPYGTTVAHGYLTLSLLARFIQEMELVPASVCKALNYGLDRVRFMAPVRAGARIRDHVVLLEMEDKGAGRMLVKMKHTIEVEGEAKPAMAAESLVLMIAG